MRIVNKRYILLLGIFLTWFGALSAYAIPADKLTIAVTPVIDQAEVIPAAQEAKLNRQLQQWYRQGVMQAAIVVVDSTDGMAIFDYALSIAERWQLGEKKRDNGLIIVAAINDRNIYILTGYGLEGMLPDISVKRIIREDITPSFKRGDYASGLQAGLESIVKQLKADPETQQAMIDADESQHMNDNAAQYVDANTAEHIDNYIDDNTMIFSLFLIAFIMPVISILIGRFLASFSAAVAVFIMITVWSHMSLGHALLISILIFVITYIRSIKQNSIISGSSSFGGGFGGFGGYSGGGGGFGGGGAGGSW